MLTLSASDREQTLQIGIVCLIFGAGMFIAHLIHQPSQSKPVVEYTPPPVVPYVAPSYSGANPAWAPIPRHKAKASQKAELPAQSSAQAQLLPVTPTSTIDTNAVPNRARATSFEIVPPPPVTLPRSLLQVQIENIDVSETSTVRAGAKIDHVAPR